MAKDRVLSNAYIMWSERKINQRISRRTWGSGVIDIKEGIIRDV